MRASTPGVAVASTGGRGRGVVVGLLPKSSASAFSRLDVAARPAAFCSSCDLRRFSPLR